MTAVTVVVVAYNSRDRLRDCVERLAALSEVRVVVVDNASSDGSLDVVADLGDVRPVALRENRGFASGCNVGWRLDDAPLVLFVNPDAQIEAASLAALVEVAEEHDDVGIVAPRILGPNGELAHSLRRFPSLRSTYAQALFVHRLFPRSRWVDETIRDPAAYRQAGPAEWASGACLLVRRTILERLDGFDEGFFMYCEDKDLCRRTWDHGYRVWYEPRATVVHEGGASRPSAELLHVLASSRIRYAQKHCSGAGAFAERVGVALGELTHVVVSRGGAAGRRGHAKALRAAVSTPTRP